MLKILLSFSAFSLSLTSIAKSNLPTQSFRNEHQLLRKKILDVEKKNEGQKNQYDILSFFEKDILPHAKWEEAVLYKKVDEKSVRGKYAFTTTMRYDHKIIKKMIEELKEQKNNSLFARQTDQILGLLKAHFEKEESVLLPVLDKTMTQEEVKKMMDSGH